MKALLSSFQGLKGFKKYTALFALGAVMTLTLPPIGFFPLLFFCVPAFMCMTRATPTRGEAFLCGWVFGAGYFIFGLYWVSAALFVDIGQWGWVLPLSLILGPAVLALFYGFIPLLSHSWRHNAPAYTLTTVVAWSAIEWLRGHVLTGFPWNLAGYAWYHIPQVMQITSLTGIYGLTLLSLFWAAMPLHAPREKIFKTATVLFVILSAWGAARLYMHPLSQNGDHTIRIVQASIPQTMKWDPQEDWRNIEKHVNLSRVKNKNISFVIWPETAVTSDLQLFPDIANYIARELPRRAIGLLGSVRITPAKQGQLDLYHNSVVALGRKGAVLAAYDKFHLVPFGEYIPFRNALNVTPLALAISNIGDFTPGTGNKTVRIGDLPSVSPLVCYEAIFPGAVADPNDRPEWLLNVTNDGWYGRTAGPYQHFETARVRAIEEGLPLARAANTGISAVIDPLGRIVARTSLMEETFIDAPLPAPLPPTVYARWGDAPFLGMIAILILCGCFIIRKNRKNQTH